MGARLVVGFGGARSCSGARAALVSRVASLAAASGGEVRVGCASGVDSLVGSRVLRVAASRLSVFCAWGPSSGSGGAARARAAASVGARVVWWAGGRGGSASSRLRGRSEALARSGLSALVAFPGPASRGTWVAVRAAVAAGVPVFVFPFGSEALPSLGRGSWVRAGSSGVWSSAWSWRGTLSLHSPGVPFADDLSIYDSQTGELLSGPPALQYVAIPAQPQAKVHSAEDYGRLLDRASGRVMTALWPGAPRVTRRAGSSDPIAVIINLAITTLATALVLYVATYLYQQANPPVQVIPTTCAQQWVEEEGWVTVCTPKGGER